MDAHNGYVFQIIGDAFCVAFHTAEAALRAAVEAQNSLQHEKWTPAPIKVRMGLHTGRAERRESDYRGYLTLVLVQRVMSAAHGGQILLSNACAETIHDQLVDGVSLQDMQENRLKGIHNLERLWQIKAPGLQHDFPPLSTSKKIPNNLPAQLTSFMGREKDIEAIKSLVTDEERLITLTGVGGAGKTRLSLQIASKVMNLFKDGVWFVELASISDPNLVMRAIAKTLGLTEVPGTPIDETLKNYLREKNLFIVLDNFEQVIDAAIFIKDILMSAPRVKILVTSRTLLRIIGEREYSVTLLSLPDKNQRLSLEELKQYEAIQLFVERAQGIKPDFAFTDENAMVVADICRRLEGLPLAIELAAARVRLLSSKTIFSQLNNRMKFLVSSSRDLPSRQQTLYGTIDWSYDLLTTHEKTLFRRLSVFEDEVTLDAIEKVCNQNDLDIINLVESLVDKSLLKPSSSDGEICFTMLGILKEYAREKSDTANETKIIRDRHLSYFQRLIESTEPELRNVNQVEWLDFLDQHIDDLRGAMQWAKQTQQTEMLLKSASNLLWFWQRRGHLTEGITQLQMTITLPEAEQYSQALINAINSLGFLYFITGDYAGSQSMFERGSGLWQGNKEAMAFGLTWYCGINMRQQKFDQARLAASQCLELYSELDQKWGQGFAHFFYGRNSLESGDIDTARPHFQQSVTNFELSGDLWGQALALNSLGTLYIQMEQLESAQAECEKSLVLRERMKDQWGINSCFLNLGDIARLKNIVSEEAYYYQQSFNLGYDLGLKGDMARAANCLGFAAFHANNPMAAVARFTESINLYLEMNHTRGICECLAGFAGIAVMQRKLRNACKLFGAVSTLLELNKIQMWVVDQTDMKRNLTVLNNELGKSEYAELWVQGSTLSTTQAIEFAIEVVND